MAELSSSDRVTCRTPTPDKKGSTRIPKWKFDLVRECILAELHEGDVPFSQLSARVGSRLSAEALNQIGSVGWHVTTVKLELECRREVFRCHQRGPQILTVREKT